MLAIYVLCCKLDDARDVRVAWRIDDWVLQQNFDVVVFFRMLSEHHKINNNYFVIFFFFSNPPPYANQLENEVPRMLRRFGGSKEWSGVCQRSRQQGKRRDCAIWCASLLFALIDFI